MKAVRLLEYGGQLVFNDVPTPAIARDEILVEIRSTAVNHLDLVEASGTARQIVPIDLPWIPGHEFSGVVEDIGGDVAACAPGDSVFAATSGAGAYAEYLAVKEADIARKPSNLSFEEAASVPVASQTAWQGIFTHGHKQKGDSVVVGIVVVTRAALLIARRASTWNIDEHLAGRSPECVAVDLNAPAQVYCGTVRDGLFRSRDSGRNWEPVGAGIDHPMVTAVDVAHVEQADRIGIVYAGTEPSAVFRSDNGGDSWVDLAGLRALPSADTWSFPPRPHTHHVRWIEADVSVADRVFVAIEAGALVRTLDGGRTWRDRVRGGPYDTHTAVTHRLASGRIYSAAGDGYFESSDAGNSWRSPEDGLKHLYLVGVAVDPADPDTVVVSATDGPGSAYSPRRAEAYVYRKTGLMRWEQAMSGLPAAKGTTVSRFATHAGEPGVIYAANNRGVFRSDDAGRSWKALDLPWPEPGLADGVEALACLPD